MRAFLAVVVCLSAVVPVVADDLSRGRIRIGERVEHLAETPHPYVADASYQVARLAWSTVIHHQGASYIAPHFARFELAEGDFVLVRSPDGSQARRYEALGRSGMGLDPEGFWSGRIHGDTAIVELYSKNRQGRYGFQIDAYGRGFEPDAIGDLPGNDPEAICGADDGEWAKCYETSEPEIYDESRALVRLFISGQFLCTGWLIGCEGHMMTNEHCITNQTEANNTDYEFMAEGATCATSCFGAFACPGVEEATSATFVQDSSPLDYALLKLPGNLSDTYGYMTLRETGPAVGERIYIPQHPAGWGKRIGVFSSHPADGAGLCEVFSTTSPPCTGGPGDVGYYCDTQGGSSGSPVLGYGDHQVVALHHCANCPNRGVNIVDVIGSLGGNMPACALDQLAGSIALDRTAYQCDAAAGITLEDDSLKGQATHEVGVRSLSEATPEAVTLTAAPAGSGTFVGSIALETGAAAAGDGAISVAHGETLTAAYVDLDDGQGGVNVVVETTALVDCLAPAISDVAVAGVTPSSATIVWQTDEPSTSQVFYGTETPIASAANSAPVTSHVIVLPALVACTDHVFSVRSDDAAGNVATDDNSGSLFTFTTECIPPQPIPDGAGLSRPLLLARGPQPDQLRLSWDDICSAPRTNLIWGPLEQVATYQLSGSSCDVGASPMALNPAPAGDLFFLFVGDDGIETESSWGEGSTGERNGTAASGFCGTEQKDVSGTCGGLL